jgi:hypothetical protein
MSSDNPGNFFRAGDFEDDDNENSDNWKPVKIYGKALYKKAIDILNVTQTICDLMPDEEYEEMTKGLMLSNALIISAKIRAAMAVDDVYSLVMENAVIIKVNVCELKAQLWACNEIHGIEKKYIEVLKEEIDHFKKIFIQWVTTFDKENDLPDEWFLFNDPTSFPDDDEPFDANEFLKDLDPDDES